MFILLESLSAGKLKDISQKLQLKQIGKKSATRLLDEIKFLSKIYAAGQGPCHNYVQERGRTGGWTDAWCQHDMKVASKIETMQETVSDVSDVVHSLKKFPVLLVMDDPCHYVR